MIDISSFMKLVAKRANLEDELITLEMKSLPKNAIERNKVFNTMLDIKMELAEANTQMHIIYANSRGR